MSILEGVLEMRQVLPADHEIFLDAVEGIADDLDLQAGVDYSDDTEVWEIALKETSIEKAGVFLEMRRFYSLIFSFEKLDREWHLKKSVLQWLYPLVMAFTSVPEMISDWASLADLHVHVRAPAISIFPFSQLVLVIKLIRSAMSLLQIKSNSSCSAVT